MDSETAQKLCRITSDFYQEHSDSFSATRRAPWSGWKRCLEAMGCDIFGSERGEAVSVLDLACGNLRFEAFLESSFPAVEFAFHAVDNCDALASGDFAASLRSPVRYRSLDIMEEILSGNLDVPACDLAVSFGFMHHVPDAHNRERVLAELVARTRPAGFTIVSFWRFLNDKGLAEKARATHARARDELHLPELDEGDYLLGWKNEPGAYRYCHSFSDGEIDALVESVADRAELTSRFSADGRTGDLNTYVVFRML